MVIDLGTGTGQSVLRAARRDADVLVIGIDPDAAAMRDASRAAARPARRGGLPNSIFLVAPAEELPGPLAGHADVVSIALPWGSLLRGLLTVNPDLLAGIRGCLKPAGEMEMLLSTTEGDGAPVLVRDEVEAAALCQRLRSAGVPVIEWRPATATDVARLSSAWGRRLGVPDRRSGWLFRLGADPWATGVSPRPARAVSRPRAP